MALVVFLARRSGMIADVSLAVCVRNLAVCRRHRWHVEAG
jgi:hypothetical protein